MTYEIYRYIFMGGAALAGVMLLLSVLLFFVLRIPKVVGDLTGATARKAIERIRAQNENTGDKTYQTSLVNKERGKLTDKITPSGKLVPKHKSYSPNSAMETEKIATQQLMPQQGEENLTTVLDQDNRAEETTLLSDQPEGNTFTVEYEITYIHTEEFII